MFCSKNQNANPPKRSINKQQGKFLSNTKSDIVLH